MAKWAALSERATTVLKVANDILGDENAARRWISAPNCALGGVVPLNALKTSDGRDQVVAILRRIEYGVFS